MNYSEINLIQELTFKFWLETNIIGFLIYFTLNLLLLLRLIITNLRFIRVKFILFVFLINFLIYDLILILITNTITSYWLILFRFNTIIYNKVLTIFTVISFLVLLNNIKSI
jgi:hypothetical protein